MESLIRMKVTNKGIICPWCPSGPPIHLCPHDPFKLMKENEELKVQYHQAVGRAQTYDRLRNALKDMIK